MWSFVEVYVRRTYNDYNYLLDLIAIVIVGPPYIHCFTRNNASAGTAQFIDGTVEEHSGCTQDPMIDKDLTFSLHIDIY